MGNLVVQPEEDIVLEAGIQAELEEDILVDLAVDILVVQAEGILVVLAVDKVLHSGQPIPVGQPY